MTSFDRVIFRVTEGEPEEIEPGVAYIVFDDGPSPLKVVLLCPCGCGVVRNLPLIPGSPRWVLEKVGENTYSVNPSINDTSGCGSHFFIREGLIVGYLSKKQTALATEGTEENEKSVSRE